MPKLNKNARTHTLDRTHPTSARYLCRRYSTMWLETPKHTRVTKKLCPATSSLPACDDLTSNLAARSMDEQRNTASCLLTSRLAARCGETKIAAWVCISLRQEQRIPPPPARKDNNWFPNPSQERFSHVIVRTYGRQAGTAAPPKGRLLLPDGLKSAHKRSSAAVQQARVSYSPDHVALA